MPIRRRGGSGGGTTLDADIVAALEGATSPPSAENVFATMADIGAGGGGSGVGDKLYLYNRMGGF